MKKELKQHACTKCGNEECEVGEINVAGGMWSKFFNVQGNRFTSLTCTKCSFTELYKGNSSKFENVLDVLSDL